MTWKDFFFQILNDELENNGKYFALLSPFRMFHQESFEGCPTPEVYWVIFVYSVVLCYFYFYICMVLGDPDNEESVFRSSLKDSFVDDWDFYYFIPCVFDIADEVEDEKTQRRFRLYHLEGESLDFRTSVFDGKNPSTVFLNEPRSLNIWDINKVVHLEYLRDQADAHTFWGYMELHRKYYGDFERNEQHDPLRFYSHSYSPLDRYFSGYPDRIIWDYHTMYDPLA